jgi:hypothetical protein
MAHANRFEIRAPVLVPLALVALTSAACATRTVYVVDDRGPTAQPMALAQSNIPPRGMDINDPSQFYDPLAPYGSWHMHPRYGYVFAPAASVVGAGWRPYTRGHWEYTEWGWTWVSDLPFGWATSHYGNWFYDGGLGWVWTPGTTWAPAWVTWRHGGGYVGWAPMPPGSMYGGSYTVYDTAWVFVGTSHFGATAIYPVMVTGYGYNHCLVATRPYRATHVYHGSTYYRGPDPTRVRQQGGRVVHRSISDVDRDRPVTRPPRGVEVTGHGGHSGSEGPRSGSSDRPRDGNSSSGGDATRPRDGSGRPRDGAGADSGGRPSDGGGAARPRDGQGGEGRGGSTRPTDGNAGDDGDGAPGRARGGSTRPTDGNAGDDGDGAPGRARTPAGGGGRDPVSGTVDPTPAYPGAGGSDSDNPYGRRIDGAERPDTRPQRREEGNPYAPNRGGSQAAPSMAPSQAPSSQQRQPQSFEPGRDSRFDQPGPTQSQPWSGPRGNRQAQPNYAPTRGQPNYGPPQGQPNYARPQGKPNYAPAHGAPQSQPGYSPPRDAPAPSYGPSPSAPRSSPSQVRDSSPAPSAPPARTQQPAARQSSPAPAPRAQRTQRSSSSSSSSDSSSSRGSSRSRGR